MKVCVVGCLHGYLATLYRSIPSDTELVICCGDFQSHRNLTDLNTCKQPPKHRHMTEFADFYAGKKTAPCLTIVVGGNHEASGYFIELEHGGWLAPNIYYLGLAGSVRVNGLRISGMSGIYYDKVFREPRPERMPLTNSAIRNIFLFREFDEIRLSLLDKMDIFISHDWATSVAKAGNTASLLRHFPRFKKDVLAGTLGAPCLTRLIDSGAPRYAFAGHMHATYPAIFPRARPAEELALPPPGASDHDPAAWLAKYQLERSPVKPLPEGQYTRFLALSKPGGPGPWYEIMDIPAPETSPEPRLMLDPEWLAIVTVMDQYRPRGGPTEPLPPIKELRAAIANILTEPAPAIPPFTKTAPTDDEGAPAPHYTNPQTVEFCRRLGIENRTNPPPRTTQGYRK